MIVGSTAFIITMITLILNSYHYRPDELRDMFGKYGKVRDVYIPSELYGLNWSCIPSLSFLHHF